MRSTGVKAPTAAGCRSLREWVAGRLDVSPETARDLVATTHRLEELPDVEEAVAAGEIGFDRAVAVGRFADRDDNVDLVNEMAGYDIVGIRRLAAKRRRMTRVDEECAFDDRYLVVEPNIDESAWQSATAGSPALRARSSSKPSKREPTRSPTTRARCRGRHGMRMRCGRSASTVLLVVTAPPSTPQHRC